MRALEADIQILSHFMNVYPRAVSLKTIEYVCSDIGAEYKVDDEECIISGTQEQLYRVLRAILNSHMYLIVE